MLITCNDVNNYLNFLHQEERSDATREKYARCIRQFLTWLGSRIPTKALMLEWKTSLHGAASTINGSISAVNGFMEYLGYSECRVKQVKSTHNIFRPEEKELTQSEFFRLVQTAERNGNLRLARAIETIAATGIRVSELRFFTVEATMQGTIIVFNKGKRRSVLMPKELRFKLLAFAKNNGINQGEIFITRSGKSLSRTQLWMQMKKLCKQSGVESTKVFPHNLRHLFAVIHYRLHRDIVKLADLLGHSNINTTRIYLIETGREHQRQLEAMRLVL